ncbi:MAG: YraN family protein [bacterium]|nr:YraN family protein [bacterium]
MDPPRDHLSRRDVGRAAEQLAARFLESRGHLVLARNLRVGRGEIDILAEIDGERAVVEVRSRWVASDARSPDPLDSFDAAKARQVRKLAASLPARARRVDLITVRFHRDGVDLLWLPRVG